MAICVILLFAIIYGLLVAIIGALGGGTGTAALIVYALLGLAIVGAQFWIGPKIVEMSMRVRYVSEDEEPELHRMVKRLSMQAGIPKPKVGISEIPIPNAFAFGRSTRDGRVCVTRKLLSMLEKEEIESVLGHEISHIKNKDMVVITALSVIPMICYFVFHSFFISGLLGGSRDENALPYLAIAGIAFIVYFISNLLVLYASRIREYYADLGSAYLTKKPHKLASALYKMIYGSASVKRDKLKEIGAGRAFLATDPMRAHNDMRELIDADMNKDGSISEYELRTFAMEAKVGLFDRIMELFSTHPNAVNRMKNLASYYV